MASARRKNLHSVFIRLLIFKLILPSVLVALALIIVSALFNASSIQQEQFLLSQHLTHTIDEFVLDARHAVTGLAPAASEGNLDNLNRLLATSFSSEPYFHALTVLDPEKKVVLFYPPEAYASIAILNRLPIFSTDSQEKVTVSQTFFSTLPGKPTTYITARLENQGWLVGELKFDLIENAIKNRIAPLVGRDVILIDSANQVIASTLANPPKTIETPKLVTLDPTSIASSDLVIINNAWAFSKTSKLNQTNWRISIYYPLQNAFGGYLITTGAILGILLFIWILVLINVSQEFRNKIFHPLTQFNQYISTISDSSASDRTRPLPIQAPFSEFHDLSQNFEQMSQTILSRQQALVENEQKYRVLIEQSGDAIYLEQDGEFVVINQKFIALFGEFKPKPGQSSGIHCLAADQSSVFVQEQQMRMLSGEVTNLRFEFVAFDKDHQEIEVEVATSVFLYRNKMAIQGVIRDITQRKRAERAEKDQRTLAEALRDTASALTSTLNLDEVMDRILNNIGSVVPCEALNIMLIYNEPREARIVASKGYSGRGLESFLTRIALRIDKTPNLSWMLKTGRPMVLPDAQNDPRWITYEETRWIASYAGAPIKVQGQVIGFLNLDSPRVNFFSTDQAERLLAFADQAGIAIHNAQLLRDLSQSHRELTDAYETTLQGWSKALELRDYETQGHTLRVHDLTISLAKRMGITEPELTHIRYGVLLHDIGKISIPDQILFKKGPLTNHEWEVMREHPKYAHQMLSPIHYLRHSLDIPYCHHERWDGSGYPRGLKGEEIPLAARIFTIVDVWDALTSDRPYHDGMPEPQVIQHIQDQAGKHLDPKIVELFIEMMAPSVATSE